MSSPKLSAEEEQCINEWASEHVEVWPDYRRWQTHFKMWDWFVYALGEEYRGTIDDYCYYLHIRSRLSTLIDGAPPALGKKLSSWIDSRDQRLRTATQEDQAETLSLYTQPGPEWWWQRIPKNGQMATQLRQNRKAE